MTGMPPLSGFLGKLMVMDGVRDQSWMAVAWTAILVGSLITIVGFARAGSVLFWKSTSISAPTLAEGAADTSQAERVTAMQLVPTMAALGVLAVLSIFAGPIAGYMEATAAQLFDSSGYINAVLAPAMEGLK
jgi:multicomponent K+:H+ antiporter subunit D